MAKWRSKKTYDGDTRRYLTPFSSGPVASVSMTDASELLVWRPFLDAVLLDGWLETGSEELRLDFPSSTALSDFSVFLTGLFSVSCFCFEDFESVFSVLVGFFSAELSDFSVLSVKPSNTNVNTTTKRPLVTGDSRTWADGGRI